MNHLSTLLFSNPMHLQAHRYPRNHSITCHFLCETKDIEIFKTCRKEQLADPRYICLLCIQCNDEKIYEDQSLNKDWSLGQSVRRL